MKETIPDGWKETTLGNVAEINETNRNWGQVLKYKIFLNGLVDGNLEMHD